uniref:caspase-2 n=1 Tax=Myxine glutinosa TaxID=7769 RepID=UPI00358EAFED
MMESSHREVLRLCRMRLIDDLVLPELLQHLITSGTLNEHMLDRIQCKGTRLEQIAELVTLLPKRGPDAFTAFCKGLQATGQAHLEKHLIATLSTLQRNTEESPTRCLNPSDIETCSNTNYALGPCDDFCDGMRPICVQPTTKEFYLQHAPTAYCMRAKPRGLALLLSNVDFLEGLGLDRRAGGEIDRANIEVLLEQLGLSVSTLHNLKGKEMEVELTKFARKEEHSEADMAAVVILSHGIDGAVYGADGALLSVERVFSLFDNGSCPRLQQKPKVFLIQACRGGELDHGVEQADGPSLHNGSGRGRAVMNKTTRLPTSSDIIYGYACLRGTMALRNTRRGSWYMEAVTNVFSQHAKDMHVADMLVQVNSIIKAREAIAPGTDYHRCKEMSEYGSTLCKSLYLFPGC